MGFTRDELARYAGQEVDDLLDARCRLLIVGINPSLWTAATGAHFSRPGNRFYPALHRAGIADRLIDPRDGMTDVDRDYLLARGIGITNVVARATATAAELSADELRVGGTRLVGLVERVAPRVVAVAGVTAYRTAFARRSVVTGRQREVFGAAVGTTVWVVPNPSGLNAHETVDSLARAYREAAVAAGIFA